jgi:DNA mismatch repair protein MutS
LAELEKQSPGGPLRPRHPTVEQLPLFLTDDPVLEELKALDITQLTPLEAINKLYELQRQLKT